MAVVTTLSTVISNYEAQPRILTSGYIAGANDTTSVANVAAASTDSIASVYKYFYLSSGVRVGDIQMQNTATTAGVWNLGVQTNDNQSLNLNAGSTPALQTWSNTVAYVPGNVVVFNGVVYYCTTGNTASQPPSGNWTTGGSQVAAPGVVPIPNAQLILGAGISTAAASTVYKSVYSPTIGATTYSPANLYLRVWELLGMINDPEYMFIVTLTATTAPTANGNIALQMNTLR